jgi:hypothetical protein
MIRKKLAQNWAVDASPMRDDRVLRATRITAAVLVPVLVTAGVILYLFPDDTERLFAWPMRPRPTARAISSERTSSLGSPSPRAGIAPAYHFPESPRLPRCWLSSA